MSTANEPILQAHRGVECEYPQNTMVSFRAAVEQGYGMIELDPGVTKDHKIVILHNKTVNATARYDDGRELEEETLLSSLTLDEVRKLDFGIFFSEKFKGERIPLLSDVLKLAEESGVGLKIDNKLRHFPEEDLHTVFSMFAETKAKICVSCWNHEIIERVLRELPRAEVHVDCMTDPGELSWLASVAPREKAVVWLPVDREKASWVKDGFATPESVANVKKFFRLGLWAVKDRESYDRILSDYRPDFVETSGQFKPRSGRKK